MATWVWPNGTTTRPHINSPFGKRTRFKTANGKWSSSNHKGVDLTGFHLVRSVTAGRVIKVGTPMFWGGGGYQVWVKNTDGSKCRYFHMVQGSARVKVGDRVHAGDVLGVMGMTGNASGRHLHLELVPKGRIAQVDPVPYIQARISSTAGGDSTPFEEDDMTPEQANQLAAVFTGMFGHRNLSGKNTETHWSDPWGNVESTRYGLLPIDIHTQTLIAQLQGQVAALTKLVEQLGTGDGTIDLAAIEAAAKEGAENGTRGTLSGLTLTAVIDEE